MKKLSNHKKLVAIAITCFLIAVILPDLNYRYNSSTYILYFWSPIIWILCILTLGSLVSFKKISFARAGAYFVIFFLLLLTYFISVEKAYLPYPSFYTNYICGDSVFGYSCSQNMSLQCRQGKGCID